MSRLQSAAEVPVNLFHAATIRDKEEAAAKQHHIEMIKEGQINIFEINQREAKAMVEQAIKKLQDEMAAKQTNAYVQGVGSYLIEFVRNNESTAEKFLTDGKTIEGSFKEMHKAAEKKKQGNFAMFEPQEGFAFIMKYFDIETDFKVDVSAASPSIMQCTITPTETTQTAPVATDTPKQDDSPSKPKKRFNVSLDELL